LDDVSAPVNVSTMIILCGVEGFPAGPWTAELALRFAERIGADLHVLYGDPAEHHVSAAAQADEETLIFGQAPRRSLAATLRAAPCPVVVAPAGNARQDWHEVILGCLAGRDSNAAAATAGALAARLDVPLRIVAVQSELTPKHWQPREELLELHTTATLAADPGLVTRAELRHGQPAATLRAAAAELGGGLLVIAADPRATWFNLRPWVTTELVHGSHDTIVIVPPASTDPSKIRGSRARSAPVAAGARRAEDAAGTVGRFDPLREGLAARP
jgi:K+-sensing histidine kinase KdpD